MRSPGRVSWGEEIVQVEIRSVVIWKEEKEKFHFDFKAW